jgi:biotin carboxyl carrier protein
LTVANSPLKSKRQFETFIDQQWVAISLEGSTESYVVRLPHRELKVDAFILDEGSYSLLIDGSSFDVTVHRVLSHYQVTVNGTTFEVALRDPKQLRHQAGAGEKSAGPASVTAPMPGKLVRLLVTEGDSVKEGQGVVVVEAMKMQNELKAPKYGTVQRVCVVEGQAVNAGEVLLTIQCEEN